MCIRPSFRTMRVSPDHCLVIDRHGVVWIEGGDDRVFQACESAVQWKRAYRCGYLVSARVLRSSGDTLVAEVEVREFNRSIKIHQIGFYALAD